MMENLLYDEPDYPEDLCGPALTWDELADDYDKAHNGRPARTLPMDKVFEWAEKRTDNYVVVNDGTIHRTFN